MKEKVNEEELIRIKKTFKSFKISMVILDILAVIILIIQIKMKDVAYYSYILLIACNLTVFLINPEKIYNKNNKKLEVKKNTNDKK